MSIKNLPTYSKNNINSEKLERFVLFWSKYRLLIVIVFVLLFLSIMLVLPNNKPVSTTVTEPENSKNAFFDPSSTNKNVTLSGKIKKINTSEENVGYAIYDSSEILAYLLSKNHDLGLSESLNVVITGSFVKKIDKYDLIEVDTIKLK